jgi:hypothetical protein
MFKSNIQRAYGLTLAILLAFLGILYIGSLVIQSVPQLQPFYTGYSTALGKLAEILLGAIFAGFAGIATALFLKESDDETEKRKIANVFLVELRRINGFIDGLLGIVTKDSLITPQHPIPFGAGYRMEPTLPYDPAKERDMIKHLKENPFYRITAGSQFIDRKNPFEIFYSKIYSLDDENLVNDLIKIERWLNDANSSLIDYFEYPTAKEHYVKLHSFLVSIEETKGLVTKILNEKKLEGITK